MTKPSFHPRIYRENYPLLDRYGPEHPATRVLQIHAEARDMCVGKEIEWPALGNAAVEQSWYSVTRKKQQLFSSFAYEFLSYDLVLDGWLKMASEPTETEKRFLMHDEVVMRALLDESEMVAQEVNNLPVLPLIAKSREFLGAYRDAILFRFRQCRIAWSPDENAHRP